MDGKLVSIRCAHRDIKLYKLVDLTLRACTGSPMQLRSRWQWPNVYQLTHMYTTGDRRS